MFYTTLPSIYFGWGYGLIAGSSIDDGLLDLSAQVRQDHQLRRQDRHAECTVTCCLWLVVLSQASFLQKGAFFSTASAHRCDYFQTRGSKTMNIIQLQFVQPLNQQYPLKHWVYLIIRITIKVKCESTLCIALFSNRRSWEHIISHRLTKMYILSIPLEAIASNFLPLSSF